MNDIIYFMKKDYEVISPCISYIPCEGFYLDNNCGTGCPQGSTYNATTKLCEEFSDSFCSPSTSQCPPGYQVLGPGICTCCADDSVSGFGDTIDNGMTQPYCSYMYTSSPISSPDLVPIELSNPAFFRDISWTVSYDPKSKAWISFHDWHPDLSFNSINHFLTTKESIPDCPPGFIWDSNVEQCCVVSEITVPRLSSLTIFQSSAFFGSNQGTPSCIDAIDINTGTTCGPDFELVLPCGQNLANNYQTSVCAQNNCNCDGNGSNNSLGTFGSHCESIGGTYTSGDDGTPCATAQYIYDIEYDSNGFPTGLLYIDPGFCNASCTNCTDPQKGTSIWRHNTRTDLYANYYGIDYPWEVDLIESSGQSVTTIRSLEYQLESYIYQNESKDRWHDLDWNFDEAIIYNSEQVSGLLRLNITPKNNPILTSTFPIISIGFIDILYSKEEQKYRFNQFWDITNDRGEFTTIQQSIFDTQWNGYVRNLNAANLNYNKAQVERKKFRHYYNHILLRRVKSENRKMLLRLNNTKLNISMR